MSESTVAQTYSLRSHAILFGKKFNITYITANRLLIAMTSLHVF